MICDAFRYNSGMSTQPKSDNFTQPLHDGELPAHGQQVITACALIHHDFDGITKVFLPRRAAHKKFLPNVYEVPGGHIHFGEDIVAGLRREVQEEFGMAINVGDPFAAFTYLNEVKGSHSIEVIYFATFADDLSKITLDPESHSEFGWFAEDELDRIVDNPIKLHDDPEYIAVRKGFARLRGEPIVF